MEGDTCAHCVALGSLPESRRLALRDLRESVEEALSQGAIVSRGRIIRAHRSHEKVHLFEEGRHDEDYIYRYEDIWVDVLSRFPLGSSDREHDDAVKRDAEFLDGFLRGRYPNESFVVEALVGKEWHFREEDMGYLEYPLYEPEVGFEQPDGSYALWGTARRPLYGLIHIRRTTVEGT